MQPDWQGQLQERCVCLAGGGEGEAEGGAARLYQGCSPEASRCPTTPPDSTLE